jgi:peptidoglycan/LPS O-acetylase OafA/YrhL
MPAQNSKNSNFPGRKIINIQALRGIAVLLVVAYHLTKIEAKYGNGETYLPGLFNIGIAGVDLFFVISGFVMVTVTHGWFQTQYSVRRFLYHRVTRIYPIYWIYSLVVLAIYLTYPDMVNFSQGGEVNIVSSFLLLPQDQLPLLMVGWTLIHEMYFYLVFALLLLFPERRLIPLLLIWGLFVIVMPQTNNAVLILISHPLTMEFIAGAFIALLLRGRAISGGGWYAAAAVIIWLSAYVMYVQLGGSLEPDGWHRVLLFGLPSVFAVYGLVAMEKNSGRQFPVWITTIGDASYSIYLSHVLVLSALGRLWVVMWQPGVLDNIVVMLVMVLMVIVVGIASYRLLERPMIKTARRYEKSIEYTASRRS